MIYRKDKLFLLGTFVVEMNLNPKEEDGSGRGHSPAVLATLIPQWVPSAFSLSYL